MKTKEIVFCLLLGIFYMACEDSIGPVGLGIQPEEDKFSVFDTTVYVQARTIQVDSVYAKTTNGMLGEFYDPTYGNIKSSYICQYYPAVGFPYLDSMVVDKPNHPKIDSVIMHISYSGYLGDSIAPMEVSVYPVIKPLEANYYTNTDPKDYCDMNNPMGRSGFTARNLTISDSVMQSMEANGNPYYISIPLPVKYGQNYLDSVIAGKLTNVDDFLKFFPGTYITTTYGTGSMMMIYMTDITLFYTRRTTLKDIYGIDSTAFVVSTAAFIATKEVIQLNKFDIKNPASFLEDNPDKTFLKTPAGVFTELTIPIKEIVKGIGKKKFSSVTLSLNAFPQDEWDYSLPFPGMPTTVSTTSGSGVQSKLLLIEPDSVKTFFEQNQVANGQTSFTTQFSSSTYSYDFKNIANVVQNAIEKAPDKDLVLWVIPVQTTWYTDQTYGSGTYDFLTSNYLYPSGVTLKKGGDNLKIRVIATDLAINN